MVLAQGGRYQVGDRVIDTALYRVSTRGAPVPVEPKVFDLLVYLIRHRDRVLSREELFQQVWGGREVSDATLSNHVKSARRALGDSGELQQTIQTVRGRGYQFIAAVQELTIEASPARKLPMTVLAAVALAGVLLVSAALFAWRLPGPADAPMQARAPRLLVLPIEVAGDAGSSWQPWTDELTRRVIGNLRQIAGLQVKDRATAFVFTENQTHDFIRKQLPDVRYVLSGVLRVASGNTPSVTMELDDLTSGEQVWTKSYAYPRSVDDARLAEMQSTITAAVSESLQVALVKDERRMLGGAGALATTSPQALALYVEGWKHLQVPDYESVKKAIVLFDRAIALDDRFYDAHLARGEAYRWIYGYYETPRDVLPKVVAAFEKARDLRPDSAEPLAALGLTYALAWDWTRAWENLSAARARDPKLAVTDLGLALYYCGLGDIERMKQALYRARDNDPLNVELADWGNWALFMSGEVDASREWANDMMAKHPAIGVVTTDAGISAYMAGDTARGVKLAEQGRVLEDSPIAQIILAQAYGYNGQKDEVRPLLEVAARSGVYTCPYESAVGYLTLGDTDTAMALMEQAYEKRSNCLLFLRVDPRLKPLRDSPRHRAHYLDLLARVGLDDEKVKSYPR
jgi:DNA-binding winged helix-turn-helix (wHTH) protein/TolB-like protein/tetratricopeptide (TPR) repeat protein